MRGRAAFGLLLWAGAATADVGEGSLRPFFEVRQGDLSHPEGEAAAEPTLSYGGGLVLSYGLTFSLSATARYGFDAAGRQSVSRANGQVAQWRHQRHLGLVGLAWAPSDELTPLLMLEGGVALRRVSDAYTLDGSGALDQDLPASTSLVPIARGTVGFEWRFADFWSVTPAGLVEYADGLGFGGQLMLGWYGYL